MTRRCSLAHLPALEITGADGARFCGADQDWYRTVWQQRAGCGPTTASVLLAYLARTRGLPALCGLERLEQDAFVDFMEQVWEYVTPGSKGLNKVSMFTDGVARFGADRGVSLHPRWMEVPAREPRPSLDDCCAFLRAGLEQDCPVAFLNLDNGEETRLDKWHWVLVTGIEEGPERVDCTIADSGKVLTIDLSLWHRTAQDLGGFVWVETL